MYIITVHLGKKGTNRHCKNSLNELFQGIGLTAAAMERWKRQEILKAPINVTFYIHVKYYNTKVHLTFFFILHNLNTVCFININNIKFIRRWNKNLTFVHITIKDKRKKYIQDVSHLKKTMF